MSTCVDKPRNCFRHVFAGAPCDPKSRVWTCLTTTPAVTGPRDSRSPTRLRPPAPAQRSGQPARSSAMQPGTSGTPPTSLSASLWSSPKIDYQFVTSGGLLVSDSRGETKSATTVVQSSWSLSSGSWKGVMLQPDHLGRRDLAELREILDHVV